MKFELGKYYKFANRKIYICGIAQTIVYGVGFVAEEPKGYYYIVGMDEVNASGWEEISKEEYLKN